MSESHSKAADNAAYCAQLVRDHDFERYAMTLFVSQHLRRPLLALAAFNVELSRIRDHVSQPLTGEIRLQWWRDLIDDVARGSVEASPVAAELMAAVAEYDLPRRDLSRLADARVFDLYDDPMPSLAVFERYCDDTAGRLFALSAQILGAAPDAVADAVHHAGVAQGIAEAIENLPLHAARKQLYLPQDVLAEAGAMEADIFAGRPTPQLTAAIGGLAVVAREHLGKALFLLREQKGEAARAFLPLAVVRRALSHDSLATGNPFTSQSISRLRMLWTMWRATKSDAFRG